MEDMHKTFIRHLFVPSVADDVERTFSILSLFDFSNYVYSLNELIMQENYTSREDMCSNVMSLIHSYIDYILNLHGIKVNPETPLFVHNEILYTVYLLQDKESLKLVQPIITSHANSVDLFSSIVSLLTQFDESYIYTLIEDVSDNFIKLLKDKIDQELLIESFDDTDEDKITSAKNVILFSKFSKVENLLGLKMIKSGFLINAAFNLYLPFIKEYMDQYRDPDYFIHHLYSVIMMSEEGYKDTYLGYRILGPSLSNNVQEFLNIEKKMNSIHLEFTSFKRAQEILT